MTHLTTDIEARAVELFQAHQAEVLLHRGQVAADAMTFDAARGGYMQLAAEAIAKEQIETAEDRWYAGQLAAMTDEQIAYRIGQIDAEVELLPYRPLTVNIADRGAGLADERRRLVAEQTARAAAPKVGLLTMAADALDAPALVAAE